MIHVAPSPAQDQSALVEPNPTVSIPPAIGFLERLPKWLICVPLVLQWMLLGLRYRSFTLPSLANPGIVSGGLVGEGKSEYFQRMGRIAQAATAPWCAFKVEPPRALACMTAAKLSFPVIAKPDIGWCGFGVRRIDDVDALAEYIGAFPHGEILMLQAFVPYTGEAGVFYVRHPDANSGRIIGLALRHFPRVCGDGRHSVRELIAAQPRLRRLQRDGLHRLELDLDEVPQAGRCVRLANIGSTRVGGLYENGAALITPALTRRIDAIARDMPDFHFGRFDLRYENTEALMRGEGLNIIEVNGAGSEAIEAWDPSLSPLRAFGLIFRKQALLFRIAAANRRRGLRPISILQLTRLHLRQQRLIRRYPPSN